MSSCSFFVTVQTPRRLHALNTRLTVDPALDFGNPTAYTSIGGSAQRLLSGGFDGITSFFYSPLPLASYGSGTKTMP
jgi:hypothetical protein